MRSETPALSWCTKQLPVRARTGCTVGHGLVWWQRSRTPSVQLCHSQGPWRAGWLWESQKEQLEGGAQELLWKLGCEDLVESSGGQRSLFWKHRGGDINEHSHKLWKTATLCPHFCLKVDRVWALFRFEPELFQPSDSIYFCLYSWHFSFRWLLHGFGWGCGLGRLVFSSSYRHQYDVLLFFSVIRHPAPLPFLPSLCRLPEEATDGPVIWFHSLDWSNTCPPLWGQEGLIPNRARSQRWIWSSHANRAQDKTTRPFWAGKAKSVTRGRGRKNEISSEEINKKRQEIAFSFWVGCYCGYWSAPPWRINWEYRKIMADIRTHLFTLKELG